FLDPLMYNETLESNENFVMAADAKMTVEGAISRLPTQAQKLLTSYYIEDKSYKDIAQEEEMTAAALKMKLFRAKRLFKKALNDNLYQQ
ncbi:MAG: sigma factor-like helix-turn-helix DNA-binding protein, partial [Patescibacteria group bacterium]